MTHDPMCFWWESQPEDMAAQDCMMCRLIAMIRADERKQAARRVSEVFWPTDGTWVTDQTTFDNLGLAAVSAARGES